MATAEQRSRAVCLAVGAISAHDVRPAGMTVTEWIARKVDWAAVERKERAEAARATTERIEDLRRILLHNTPRHRDVDALTNEESAAQLLISARKQGYHDMLRAILAKAIEHRWPTVVRAIVKHFDDHPIGPLIQELWDRMASRASA